MKINPSKWLMEVGNKPAWEHKMDGRHYMPRASEARKSRTRGSQDWTLFLLQNNMWEHEKHALGWRSSNLTFILCLILGMVANHARIYIRTIWWPTVSSPRIVPRKYSCRLICKDIRLLPKPKDGEMYCSIENTIEKHEKELTKRSREGNISTFAQSGQTFCS